MVVVIINHMLQEETKGTILDVDVTKLKQLAGSNANPEHWYIAADKSILLNHLNFLKLLIHSGNCIFVVSVLSLYQMLLILLILN